MNNKKEHQRTSPRQQNLTRFLLVVALIILVNLLASFVFFRFDLTSEKRFTLTQSTRQTLSGLQDVIFVKVYLHGEFPPSFRKLENATREMLDEMRVYAGDNLQYEFIDPSADSDPARRNELYRQLVKRGLLPTQLQTKEKEGSSQRVIFPGALITYLGRETSVQLLEDQIGISPEQIMNISVQNIEYQLMNGIKKAGNAEAASIAFIEGHGELGKDYIADLAKSLSESYSLERVTINGNLHALKNFKTAIIAKPVMPFDEKDKFVLDQFLMKGGRILWLVDPMMADMDSLSTRDEILAVANDLNLDDMLFRYGVRINYDLVQDLLAAPIPVVTGNIGSSPQQSFLPWTYFPLVIPTSSHPVVHNINAIRFQFASSMDVVGTDDINKTVLLASSEYSRVQGSPVRVSLEIMRKQPDPKNFNQPKRKLAVLLEGSFTSSYLNRIPPVISSDSGIGFRTTSVPTRMVVVSDGDVIRNDFRKATGQSFPLGYDRYTGQTYGNKNFLLNVIDYLSDDANLLSLRSKEFRLRLLDKTKIAQSRQEWQMLVSIGPVVIILLFALVKSYLRRKKYSS